MLSKSQVTSSTTYLFPVCTDRFLRKRSTFVQFRCPLECHLLGVPSSDFYWSVVKINGSYYRNTLLRQRLLPAIRSISGPFFTFQQDNAPAHRARKMVALLLSAETPDIIGLQYCIREKGGHFEHQILALSCSCKTENKLLLSSCTVVRLCDLVYGLISQ